MGANLLWNVGPTCLFNKFDLHVVPTCLTNERIDYCRICTTRVQIHYGTLDQHVGTEGWTNMLYQLVVLTCLTNERIDCCRIYSYAEISVKCWYNIQLVVPTFCVVLNMLCCVGTTFTVHTNIHLHIKYQQSWSNKVGITCWSNKLVQHVDPTFHSEFVP